MYAKLLKVIFYVWGIIFLVFGSKIVLSNSDTLAELHQKIWNQVNHIDFDFDFTPAETMTLGLIKKYGMTISGMGICKDTYKSGRVNSETNSLLSNISSSCWNGECKIKLAFKDEIPETIQLNVEIPHSDTCHKKMFVVGDSKDIIGYKVKIVLTPELKEKLGISTGNEEIRFKHDTGFTRSKINGKDEMTFDFDTLLQGDIITVDGKDKITIDFELI